MHFFRLPVLFIFLAFFSIAPAPSWAQKAKKENKRADRSVAPQKQEDPEFNFYFFNGLKEKTLGNIDNALDNFIRCLQRDEHNDAVLFELAKIYVSKGQKDKALAAIAQALKSNPDQEWYLQFQGQLLEDANRSDESADVYKHLLELYPDRVEYFFRLANAYISSNQYGEAIKVYDRLESQIGITEDVSVQKQKIYLKQKKVDKAVAEVDKLIANNPTEIRYYMMAGEILLGNKLPDQAMTYYNKGLKLDPNNGYLVLAIADYYRAKKDEANAYEYVKRAFSLSDIDIDTKVRILYPFFGSLDKPEYYKQALELSEIMVKSHPQEAKAYAMYGDFLAQKQEGQEQAAVQYRKAVRLDPSIYAIWDQLVRLEIGQKAYDAAIVHSDSAIALFPTQANMYFLNGVAKAQKGEHKAAVSALKNGLSIGSGNKALMAEMNASLGDSYHELNLIAASDSAYEAALAIDPEQAYVLNNYSYYLSLRGEGLEKAERMSKKSLDLDPKNASFLDTYGWILYKLNRYEEAKRYIEKAIAEGGGSATVMEHYGDILYKLGETVLALDNWKKAKEAGGKSTFLDKKIADKKLYE